MWGFNDGSGPPLLAAGQVPAPCTFLNMEGANEPLPLHTSTHLHSCQANMYSKAEYMSLSSTFSTVRNDEGGILKLWKGILPRMARIICATFILNYVKTNSVNHLEEGRK